jgi:hypothetical protein
MTEVPPSPPKSHLMLPMSQYLLCTALPVGHHRASSQPCYWLNPRPRGGAAPSNPLNRDPSYLPHLAYLEPLLTSPRVCLPHPHPTPLTLGPGCGACRACWRVGRWGEPSVLPPASFPVLPNPRLVSEAGSSPPPAPTPLPFTGSWEYIPEADHTTSVKTQNSLWVRGR